MLYHVTVFPSLLKQSNFINVCPTFNVKMIVNVTCTLFHLLRKISFFNSDSSFDVVLISRTVIIFVFRSRVSVQQVRI